MTESELIQTILVRGARIEERIISLSDKLDYFIDHQEINTKTIEVLKMSQTKVKTVMSLMCTYIVSLGGWIIYFLLGHDS